MLFTPHPTKAPLAPADLQRGFVLVTALIFLMVLSVLSVMAVRGSLFEERFAANDGDTALARANAELALRDAERDILGLRFDGQFCAAVACITLRPANTRPTSAIDANFWTGGSVDIETIASENYGIGFTVERQGVFKADAAVKCGMPIWGGAFWNDGVTRTCAGTIGAAVPTIPYGTFTNAPFAQPGVTPPRYLIEIFTGSDLQMGDPTSPSKKIIFRITAVGFGRTVGSNNATTSVTLQSVFSPR